jgi:hypothetical protein
MSNDIINYIANYCVWIKNKGGFIIKARLKIIIKSPSGRYVIDGWKIPKEIEDKAGYSWCIDIIYHFSKYLWSYQLLKTLQKILYSV